MTTAIHVPAAVCETDAAGVIRAANDRFVALFGVAASGLVGRTLASLFDPPSSALVVAAIAARTAPEPGVGLGAVTASGAPLELEIAFDAAPDAEGELVVALVDVTVRAAALRRLHRSNEALREFAGAVSHDLQSPLRHVALFAELITEEAPPDSDSARIAAKIGESVGRMQRLTASLLDYAKVAHAEMRPRRVDVRRVVDDVLELLALEIEEARARVDIGPLPTVLADPELLARVFQNLIGNAVKYRSEAPPEITIRCRSCPRAWEFEVVDNGIGIDPRFAERVMEPFQRLHRDEKRYAGVGIGLALARRIVESHGGRVWVDTARPAGARLCFTLPAE